MTQDQHYRRILRERPATAHHEAGHVVIATIEGLRFQRVSIVEDTEGGLGRTVGAAHPVWTVPTEPSFAPKRAFKYYERFGRVAYAGGIAQAVYLADPAIRSDRRGRDLTRSGSPATPIRARVPRLDARVIRQSEALTSARKSGEP